MRPGGLRSSSSRSNPDSRSAPPLPLRGAWLGGAFESVSYTHLDVYKRQVMGSPLARRGLEPGDDVIVYYEANEPHRCLVIEKVKRKLAIVDAV